MLNVLKAFVWIVVSCFGIGFSVVLPGFLNLILIIIFGVLDSIGVFLVLKYSKSDLWGVFYTFCPSLTLAEVIRGSVFINGTISRVILLSLEYSFISVLFGLLVYSVFLFIKKIEL